MAHQRSRHALRVGIQLLQESQSLHRDTHLHDTSVRLTARARDEPARTQLIDESGDIRIAGYRPSPNLAAGQGRRVAVPEYAQDIEQTCR